MEKSKQQQSLAYMLADELQNTTAKFVQNNPQTTLNGILGAANIYLASWLTSAPNKAVALKGAQDCRIIINNLIESTPDAFFGNKAKGSNLN